MDGISSLLRGNPQYINLLSYVDFWLRDLFPNAVASEKAWKVLNDLASEAFKTNKTTFNHICSPYLIDKVCSGATAAGKKVYLLKGKPSDADIRSIGRGTITLKPAHNPFEDKNYIDFLKVFQGDPKVRFVTAMGISVMQGFVKIFVARRISSNSCFLLVSEIVNSNSTNRNLDAK